MTRMLEVSFNSPQCGWMSVGFRDDVNEFHTTTAHAPHADALPELMRILKPEGALFALFGTVPPTDSHYTRYIIVDDATMKTRPYPAARARRSALNNRQILNLFEPLRVSDSFLLQSHLREILFRKAAADPR